LTGNGGEGKLVELLIVLGVLYTFEVGEKNKGKKQIAGDTQAYLAVDDLEYGVAEKIPLWLFGFLY